MHACEVLRMGQKEWATFATESRLEVTRGWGKEERGVIA